MTRAEFKAHEWLRIAEILKLRAKEEAGARLTLLRMHRWAQEEAKARVNRLRTARHELKSAAAALEALETALAPIADPARVQDVETAARIEMNEICGPPLALYELDESGMPAEELRQFRRDAARLRLLIGKAIAGLSASGGRPRKVGDQADVIGDLAHWFGLRAGKRATSSEAGAFAELVRLVLGVEKAGDLIRRASLPRTGLAPSGHVASQCAVCQRLGIAKPDPK